MKILLRLPAALLLLAAPAPAAADPAERAAGERLFRNQCRGCHSVGAGENRAGPTLYGLFGRRSGTVAGFNFSAAMKDAAIEWTPERLDRFLTGPSEMVPGTKMVLWGLDERTRRRIIAYLESLAE